VPLLGTLSSANAARPVSVLPLNPSASGSPCERTGRAPAVETAEDARELRVARGAAVPFVVLSRRTGQRLPVNLEVGLNALD
jgi:hypothetical protein